MMTRSPTHNQRIHQCSVSDGMLTEVVPIVENVLPLICKPFFSAILYILELPIWTHFPLKYSISKNYFFSIPCNSRVGYSLLIPSFGSKSLGFTGNIIHPVGCLDFLTAVQLDILSISTKMFPAAPSPFATWLKLY